MELEFDKEKALFLNGNWQYIVSEKTTGRLIAIVYGQTRDIAQANAALMVAGPILKKAIDEILGDFSKDVWYDSTYKLAKEAQCAADGK